MVKFKFRLATLLKLRENTREERRRQLAEACRVDELLKRQIEGIDEQIAHLRHQCRAAVNVGDVKLDTLVAAQRNEMALRYQRGQLVKQREHVATEIEKCRDALIEADREVRILEKLEEKQLARHREEELRAETKELDEAGILRWNRKEIAQG